MSENFFFDEDLSVLDPDVDNFIAAEKMRQSDKLLMIPSESICPKPVLEALSTPFTNKYAEGYPSLRMTLYERGRIDKETERYLAFHRRYGDRRFYKGAEFCNFIEVLAQRRAAEIFANPNAPVDSIFVNVQPLSGAAANNAVYNAFLVPGDTMMGMALSYGGHLSHGSPFNRSGRQYRVIPYPADIKTGRLDYNLIKKLALEHKPKIIVAGASAYPWSIDWQKLREIADAVPAQIPGLTKPGAILMADISHPAGLVVAGFFPNPVGLADITTLTTHKTLCGPRGAIIIATEEEIAKRIDLGVFPGEQGGPHLNNIAAKAVCFKIAQSDKFKKLQKKITENCRALAAALEKLGCQLAYGGTNTHMLLVDLDGIRTKSGIPLKGDVASNILDLCGITCNKNALPGDETGARPRGIRFGTTILSQQGMGFKEMGKIAQLVYKVLTNIHTFKIPAVNGELSCGKIPLEVIEQVKNEVSRLLQKVKGKTQNVKSKICNLQSKICNLEIAGERASAFLQQVITHDIFKLKPGDAINTILLDARGKVIDEIVVKQLPDKPTGDSHYLISPHPEKTETIFTWLAGLSDGYILFDEDDVYAKIDGPVVVRRMRNGKWGMGNIKTKSRKSAFRIQHSAFDLHKPYFIGQNVVLKTHRLPVTDGAKRSPDAYRDNRLLFKYQPYQGEPRKTYLYEEHLKLTKKQFMIPFAGWSMPVWYTRASEEHLAVRQAAGLFDVSHMGRFRIKGKYATRFLDLVSTNYVPKLRSGQTPMQSGQAHYSYILDPDGQIMDDIFLYKFAEDDYVIICNAANAEKIGQWLRAVNDKSVLIDNENPARCVEGRVEIIDIRDPAAGTAQLVNIALQGPNSSRILLKLLDKPKTNSAKLRALKKSHFDTFDFGGIQAIATRTGYTGEDVGFEIFVEHTEAAAFWNLLLTGGHEFGLKPCGLAARDSLRTEAGLPLYGHELNGRHDISATEAGYGAFIKRHKGFFIGRKPYLNREKESVKNLVRFEIKTPGARMIKPEDPVADKNGQRIGLVTSCTLVPSLSGQGATQVGLAYINKSAVREREQMDIFPTRPARSQSGSSSEQTQGNPAQAELEPVKAEIVSRFPLRKPATGISVST